MTNTTIILDMAQEVNEGSLIFTLLLCGPQATINQDMLRLLEQLGATDWADGEDWVLRTVWAERSHDASQQGAAPVSARTEAGRV